MLFAALGCDRARPPADAGTAAAAAERPALSITLYQSGLELFMEYPALVVGEDSPLIAHFTDARDPRAFRPITRGRVTATLTTPGGEQRFVAEQPLRDGIFKPVVRPTVAGEATLTLVLEGDQQAGRIDVGKVVVHPSVAAIPERPEAPAGAEEEIPFLKEQQWKTEYATAAVEPRVLQGGIHATGEIKPVASQFVELSAPTSARVAVGGPVVHLGQQVRKGQILVRLIPTGGSGGADAAALELEVARARAEAGLAERELQRAEELFAARAIPEKQLDGARVARTTAAARLQAAEQQRSQLRAAATGGATAGAVELPSPLDGVVAFAELTPGAVVAAGQRLVSVVNTERVWLEARVFEVDAPKIARSPGASFTVAGFDRPFVIDAQTGRRIAVGAVIDPVTRTVPVLYERMNPDGELKPGMHASVTLFTGETIRGLAIPESALVDEAGKPTVFVMAGGESFFKRSVRTGIRTGGYVQVLEGVKEGDRVVSRGAYELKLITASGTIPEHGHQH